MRTPICEAAIGEGLSGAQWLTIARLHERSSRAGGKSVYIVDFDVAFLEGEIKLAAFRCEDGTDPMDLLYLMQMVDPKGEYSWKGDGNGIVRERGTRGQRRETTKPMRSKTKSAEKIHSVILKIISQKWTQLNAGDYRLTIIP